MVFGKSLHRTPGIGRCFHRDATCSCTQILRRKKLILEKIFIDAGISGLTDKRPQFREMIREAEGDHPPAFIIYYDTSRFSRSRYDSIVYKRQGTRGHPPDFSGGRQRGQNRSSAYGTACSPSRTTRCARPLRDEPCDQGRRKNIKKPNLAVWPAPRAGQLAALVHFVTNLATKVAGKT